MGLNRVVLPFDWHLHYINLWVFLYALFMKNKILFSKVLHFRNFAFLVTMIIKWRYDFAKTVQIVILFKILSFFLWFHHQVSAKFKNGETCEYIPPEVYGAPPLCLFHFSLRWLHNTIINIITITSMVPMHGGKTSH